MVRFDALLKRLRITGEARPYERIPTVDGCKTMVPTQACRFRELQSTRARFERKSNKLKAKAHYSLIDAARLLRSDVDEILVSAAAGRLQCFVISAGLRGKRCR